MAEGITVVGLKRTEREREREREDQMVRHEARKQGSGFY
jgi:hypothetical protein